MISLDPNHSCVQWFDFQMNIEIALTLSSTGVYMAELIKAYDGIELLGCLIPDIKGQILLFHGNWDHQGGNKRWVVNCQ